VSTENTGTDSGRAETEEVKILLVDDHASFRQGVAAALEAEPDLTVAGQAGSLAEARTMLDGFDVAVVDLGLPDGFGGDLIRELRAANPRAQALVLSATGERAEIARAVESGAAGVLHKSSEMAEVADSVRRLRAGETLMPLEEVVELLRFAGARKDEEHDAKQAISSLTEREREDRAQPRGEHPLQAGRALPPAGGPLRRASRPRRIRGQGHLKVSSARFLPIAPPLGRLCPG
jgi:DNA-binding NarL/FixJ family response regulator